MPGDCTENIVDGFSEGGYQNTGVYYWILLVETYPLLC